MPKLPRLENRVRERRERKGWSQDELARRSALSRAGVSAIETGRLVPSAAAALSLAAALECRVEDLFRLDAPGAAGPAPAWAWPPRREPCRYWKAEVGGRAWLYPAEATPAGVLTHDGLARDGVLSESAEPDPSTTLVVATCDPAVALLGDELRRSGVRLLPLPRSSRAALTLLGDGLVHAAGLHLAPADPAHDGNASAVRERLGPGYRLLRVARWDEGLCLAPSLGVSTVRSALGPGLRWVGREEGSGARQCLDELLGDRRPPRRIATDHRGVAEAVRHGWADLGVCLRLPAEESGLDFLEVRRESYDLCYPSAFESDPRLRALIAAVRSPGYRRALAALPGYDPLEAGELAL